MQSGIEFHILIDERVLVFTFGMEWCIEKLYLQHKYCICRLNVIFDALLRYSLLKYYICLLNIILSA